MTTKARITFEAEDKTRSAIDSVKAGIAGVQGAGERAASFFATGFGAAAAGGLLATAMQIRAGIDELDRLDETAPKIGLTAQRLAEFGYNAKMSGASTEVLEKGIATLSQKMAAGDKVFAAMGVTIHKANGELRATDEVLEEMADKFAGYADGPAKVALASEAMGKSGRELIPMLNQGSEGMRKMAEEARALGLAFGPDSLKQAAEYKDNIDKLQVAAQGAGIAMAERMLPGLIQVTNQMVEGAKQGGVLLGIWRGLAEFSKIAFGTDEMGKAISETGRLNKELVRVGDEIDKQLAILERDPDNAAAQRRLNSLRKQLGAVQKDALAASDAVKRAINPGYDSDPSFDTLEGKRLARRPKGEAPKVPGGGATEKSEYQKLNEELTKRQTLLDAAREAGDKLSEGRKFEIEMVARLDASLAKLTTTQAVELEAKVQFIKAEMDAAELRKSEFDQAKAIADQRQKARADDDKASTEALRAIEAERTARGTYARETLADIQFEIQLMGMSTTERAKAVAMRDLERNGIKQGTEAWDQYAEAIQRAVGDRAAVQAHIDQFQDFWQSIDGAARDTFRNVTEDWESAVTRLRKTAQTVFFDWLYEQAARPVLFNVIAQVTGASSSAVNSVATGVQGSGGIAGLIGNGSSLGMFGQAAGATMQNGLISGFGANMSNIATLAEGGSLMGAAGAAMPYIGIGLMAAQALGLFDRKGGPKTEGGGDLASTIGQQYAGIAQQLGITNQAKFEAFYSKDPEGDSLTQLRVAAFSGGRHVYERPGEENVGRSDAEFTAAVGDATVRAIIAALKESDLAAEYKQHLNSLTGDSTTADMERAISLIAQRKALDEEWLTATSTDAENLARARKRELDAMDPTLRAIKERIWAEQDLAKQSATTAAQQAQLSEALLDQVRAAESAARDAIARQDAAAQSLRRYLGALTTGPQAGLSPEAQYTATRAEFMRLSSLSLDDPERQSRLEEVGDAFLEASRSYNASSMTYFTDLAAVRGAVEASQVSAQTQADLGRMQLSALQTSTGLLSGILSEQKTTSLTIREAMDQLIAALAGANVVSGKGTVTNTGTANSVVTGLYQTMLGRAPDAEGLAYWSQRLASGESLASVRAAMQASAEYVNSQGGSAAAPAPSAPSSTASVVEGLYGSMLGRSSDAEGLAYWSDRLSSGESLDSVRAAMQASAEYVNRTNGVPGYAGGGVADGWAWVGEEGPELVNFTQPSRVYTADQSRGMWAAGTSTGDLERRIDETNAKLDALISITAATGRRLDPLAAIEGNTAGLKRAQLRESVMAVPS